MKHTLFLLATFLLLILMLASCGETAGTTPAATTTGATATTTVTTATTTVATTTAAPTPVSKNYLKEVTTMKSGSIRITLCDGTRLNLGDLPLREGYPGYAEQRPAERLSGRDLLPADQPDHPDAR